MSAGAIPKREDLVLTRVLDAPRELVFKAWTDPKQVAEWWGPNGFTNIVHELDVRPGGAIRIDMLPSDEIRVGMGKPEGTVFPMSGTFREIVPPERLVFVSSALDENGKAIFDVLSTVELTEQGGKTTLKLTARVLRETPEAEQYIAGMQAGWTQSLERLAAFVARTKAKQS